MKKTMMILAFAAMGLTAIAGEPKNSKTETLTVDATQSTMKWHAEKVTGKHDGTVKLAGGTVIVDGNKLTGGTIEADMTTIENTDVQGEYRAKLVNHLKSDDFFSVATHPKAVLVIKKAEVIKNQKSAENTMVTADLTIKGITNEITFPAIVVIKKGEVIANADINIDRTKYNIKYGSKSFIEGIGDKAIDDQFNLKVRVVAVK